MRYYFVTLQNIRFLYMEFIKKHRGIDKLHSLILEAKSITVIGHTHPDGDAIGSCIGMASYIETLGKDVVIAFPDGIDYSLEFMLTGKAGDKTLIFTKEKEKLIERLRSSDLIICQDFNSFTRTEGLETYLRESQAKKVLIDHHLNPDTAAFDLAFSTADISSTCELVFYILMEMPEIGGDAGKLPKDCAEALMAGMTTDTNNFANSVFPTTFEMAARLISAGTDRDRILKNLYNEYRENRLRAIGYMLNSNMKITPDGAAYMIMTKEIAEEYGLKEGETEGLVNIPLAISEVSMSVFLKEDENYFRVSVRSKEGVSANNIARQYFNGGGHERAAGGRLYFPENIKSRDDSEAYVVKAAEEFFKQG